MSGHWVLCCLALVVVDFTVVPPVGVASGWVDSFEVFELVGCVSTYGVVWDGCRELEVGVLEYMYPE